MTKDMKNKFEVKIKTKPQISKEACKQNQTNLNVVERIPQSNENLMVPDQSCQCCD